MQVSVYIATSLDGYIARPDGSIDWLIGAGNPGDPEDYGYADFMAAVDCLVMGRATFDMVSSFPEWPYAGKRVIVVSRSLAALPPAFADKAELSAEAPAALAARLAGEGVRRVYLDGGQLIQAFLAAGLVHDITLTRVPLLIGAGRPLFGPLPGDLRLQHVQTRSWPNGFVQSVFQLPAGHAHL